jgi:hypothetical protein
LPSRVGRFAIRCRERKKSLGLLDTYTLPYFAILCREL